MCLKELKTSQIRQTNQRKQILSIVAREPGPTVISGMAYKYCEGG